MVTIESLPNLHSLNWLERYAATLPAGKAKQHAVMNEADALRRRLLVSLLAYHQRQTAQKRPSVVRSGRTSCGACHLRLPMGLVHELRMPGRYVLCPHCGVFNTVDAAPAQVAERERNIPSALPV